MSNSYYNGSQRCEDCGEMKKDVRERDIAGLTEKLCGKCALNRHLKGRKTDES